MEKNIEEKLMELKELYKDSPKLEFDWEQKNGLRYVSDESLELAYEILKNYKISIELKDEKIVIHTNLENLCDYKYTTDELIKTIKEDSKTVEANKEINFTTDKNISVNRMCYQCKFQRCPKHLAGYIFYLINKNLLEEKLEDRKKFRQENEVNEYYAFEWKYGNILKIISDEMYEFCYQVAKENLIYVRRLLQDNETMIKIESAISCAEYKLLYGNLEKLKNINKPYDEWKWFMKRNPNSTIKICNTYDCSLRGCPFAIAGIIQYLINSGKEEVLIKERQYYKEHQEEMNKELDQMIENREEIIGEKINSSLKNLKEYENQIDNFGDLISSLINKNQKNFHCIIEGDDIEERRKFIDNIVEFLYNDRKMSSDISRLSLQNLTASNVYATSRIKEKDDDPLGVPRYADSLIKYTILDRNKIYILDRIKEFVKDYKIFIEQKGTSLRGEIRKKQFSHVVQLLTDISQSNYIILEGTSKEIEEFLSLEPRLQYVYQNSRFKLPEFSIDESFSLYTKTLNNTIFKKLKKNEEEYKEKFIEYVSLNKNGIPFSKRELASYLAMYSNSKGDVVFPDNIYKKETVDEALKNIIGLEKVKEKVKEFEKYMMYKIKAEAHGIKLSATNMHMIFTGNPGTGKTTIARIMAKMLYDMGIIKENKLIEVERKDLVAAYIGQTAIKTAEVISNAMGGVLFIDEAYSLAGKSSNDYGKEAIATLIKAMEDQKDNLVVIFAGYKNEMKEFLDINPGIASRIGYTFDFDDYSVDELMKIFYKKMENMGFSCNKKCDVEIKRICTYFSQRKNFGNGRFIDKLIQETILKHAINNNKNVKQISERDIPTIQEMNNTNEPEETTDELLAGVVGLENLKEKIKKFENYVKFIKKAEKNNISVPNQNMHMIFTGNPGTGKTTIARIMAKILYNSGIIHENKLIEVERKDLIGEHAGQTAPKTYDVIEKAIGGILFIDEAYSLASKKGSRDSLGEEAIATLIKAMEDHKGEFIVIFAGYKNEMAEFINMNSGIASRIGYIFDFPDYDVEDLLEIFYKKIEKAGFKCSKECNIQLRNICTYFSSRKNFGNGRFVDKLIQEVIIKHAENGNKNINEIIEIDIPTIKEMNNTIEPEETTEELLANVIGLDSLKLKIKEFEDYVKFIKEAEKSNISVPNQNMHMIFTGNPGTGKTTIARIMAKILYNAGIIQENKLVEVERKDLIAGYIGQTAPKTYDVIEKSMGGILFIDEAYSLAQKTGANDDFGEEAIATLIKAMEDHKGEFIVIFAGYKKEMAEFINMNSGISSRIGYTFDFPDYTVEELLKIFYKKIEKAGFKCSKECNIQLRNICTYFSNRKNFGNGRFVDKLIQEVIIKHAENKNKNLNEINESDIPTIKEINNTIEPEETTDELLANVIGLDNLKLKIKEFEDYVKFIKEAEKNNIIVPNQNMHMIFTGNPGTGKTTIARIMAKILYNAGIIQENKLVEVERKDLIAGYIGQTAPKTYDVIEKAMGGILFIDEAYSLAQKTGANDSFGEEAIATLIKAMEDHKGEFIVIFAGYKKEMAEFININSGISSRIGYVFDFPDYSREELAEILYRKIGKHNLEIDEQAKAKVFEIMNYFCRVENIGNGRFADKVFQEILIRHAKNKDKDIQIIKENDIPTIKEMTNSLFNGDRMINPDIISNEALKRTAIHEIGHAFVRYKLFEMPGILKITINPEGSGTLGYVSYKTQEGTYTNGKKYWLNRIKGLLAGMASEEIFTGEFENGNTSDLEKATNIARNMVTRWGMSDLGFGQIDDANGPMAIKIQEEINSILAECYEETKMIIKQNRSSMVKVIKFLLKKKEITEEEFFEIIGDVK